MNSRQRPKMLAYVQDYIGVEMMPTCCEGTELADLAVEQSLAWVCEPSTSRSLCSGEFSFRAMMLNPRRAPLTIEVNADFFEKHTHAAHIVCC